MPLEPDLFGYVLYLCEIFVPGLGIGELLNIWRPGSGLMQRLGYAFGLGLGVDTVVLVVRTSGLRVAGHALRGIDVGTLYFIICLGLISLGAAYALRRKFLMPVKPTVADWAVLGIVGVLAAAVAYFFQSFPIFPEFPSQDFGTHVQTAQELIAGTLTSFPRGVLYYGVHFQLASALVFVGGQPLVTVRQTMGILVILSPILVYTAASRLFSNSQAGLVAVALYALSGSVWFDSVFDSGLYANFFGLLIAFFFIVALLDVSERLKSVQAWTFFGIMVVALYFSHYTTVTLLPAIFVVAALQFWKFRSFFKGIILPTLITMFPGLVVVVAEPRLVRLVLYLGEEGVAGVNGGTTLSSALAFFPALGYLAVEINDDIAFVCLFLFSAICIYRGVHSRATLLLLPLFWAVALLVSSPQNVSAWRFSYEALLPLTLMAAYGVWSVLPRLKIQRRRTGESNALRQYAKVGLVCLLLLSPMVVGSWTTTSAYYESITGQAQSQSQQNVYNAMFWLKDNTPANSTYLSVSDWRFVYSDLIIGRNSSYAYYPDESQAISFAQQNGFGYIIVTQFSTLSLPYTYEYPWNTFQSIPNATLIYNSTDVEVFQVH